jgi:hypothetical protein
MAVWIQIIGLRKSNSTEHEKEKISEILNKAEFNFNFLKRNSDLELKQAKWNLNQSNGIEFFELLIFDKSLKIYFDNPNFIEFSGSFDLFSSWFWFVDKQNSALTNGIRKIFNTIASEYGISELMYFSEWFFELDEIRKQEETFEDLIKRMNDNLEREKKELFGLQPNEYYIEKISPVANNSYKQ